MRILYLPSWYPSHKDNPKGSFFREQVLAVAAEGVEAAVVTVELLSLRSIVRDCNRIGVHQECDDGVNTYRVVCFNIFPRLPSLKRFLCRLLFKYGYTRYVRDNGKPDIVHVQSVFNAGFAALDFKKRYGVPYIIGEHSSGFVRDVYAAHDLAAAAVVYQEAAYLYAVSTPFAGVLASKYQMIGDRWHVLHNSVNDIFGDRKDVSKYETWTFLNISFLAANKKIDNILHAFCKLSGEYDNLKLRIGGDGQDSEKLKKLAVELGIEKNVSFLGSLTREQVAQEMSRAHCYVLSSNVETFGVVAVEALASGIPVIATRCGGPEDIIISDDLGIMIEKDNVDELVQAMRHVMARSYDRDYLRNYCKSHFSSDVIAKKMVNVYQSVMSAM